MSLKIFILIAVFGLSASVCDAQPPAPAEGITSSKNLSPAYRKDRFWVVSSRQASQDGNHLGCGPLGVWTVDCSDCLQSCPPQRCPLQIRRSSLNEGEFQTALTPGIPVCIFVHGSYVDWETAFQYSWKTFRWLRRARPEEPLQVIFWSWPSDAMTYVPQVDFNILGERAGRTGFHLSRVIRNIPVESPVSLIGHSQGSRVVVSALHLLGGGQVQGYRLPLGYDPGHRIRTVIVAGAIDHQWMNPCNRYGRAVGRTEALLNLVNRRDWVLSFYHLRSLDSGHAVSRNGFQASDYQQMGALSSRIHQLDVTRAMGKKHIWPSYLSCPGLSQAISPYVYFSESSTAPGGGPIPSPANRLDALHSGTETRQRFVSK